MSGFSLKGCLWKPGINGLGVRGFHMLPYRKRFDAAARGHDFNYDIPGDGLMRLYADIKFFRGMADVCMSDLQCAFAVFYFIMVRMLGWAFYRYNR